MRKSWFFFGVLLLLAGGLIANGCSDSQSISVSGTSENVVANKKTVEITEKKEMPVDVFPVRIWLCDNSGSYVFDD